MKIGIGNDHAAYEMKLEIKKYLEELGHEVVDFGCHSTDRANYPEFGEKVGRAVAAKEVDCGVLICGTGIG
ncbi:MAG: RpiB/LacA/LacB family sugar-phosphate isomerase, partial [Lachnospiraceae bacterium]|nr:RpiB/LacA/LacB family sugar-phosphate isomerase [Lachnospiraceae bacterium]